MPKVIGVDVGGTFTDVVEYDGAVLTGRKIPTSQDQSTGVASAVSGASDDQFLHGTTAATNALLEERGALVALVTNSGYEDLIEIGRQDRPSLYDSAVDRPTPLVRRGARIADGPDLVNLVVGAQPEAVAIMLVESYLNPNREEEIAETLQDKLSVPVLTSSSVSPEFREYERLATTVLSAYLTPSVSKYLRSLDERLAMDTRLIMTSAGGLIPFEKGPDVAGRLVLSGPAAGAVAAAALGDHHGHSTVLSFDMGGTSTDVSRISDGQLSVGAGHQVAGRTNRVPSIPIRTIGAGGGSIAWSDSGGALRVGPRSAGATPGPGAYGQGGLEPTVTDANLVMGHIPSGLALGGSIDLDLEAARAAIQRLGDSLALSLEATSLGILEVVDSHMEHALRAVSVEEGDDPRSAVLVAFGGAGGLHATKLARRLGVAKVLVPPLSGVFSALGLMLSAPRSDVARTVMLDEHDQRLPDHLGVIDGLVRKQFGEVFSAVESDLRLSADVRYRGQSHELEVPADAGWDGIRTEFQALHSQRFGFFRADADIEVVNVRAVATGQAPLRWSDLPNAGAAEPKGAEGVWQRDTLHAGFEMNGPGVIVEENSAVLLEHDDRLVVLEDGSLEINCE